MKTTLQNTLVGQAQGPNSREFAGLPTFDKVMSSRS